MIVLLDLDVLLDFALNRVPFAAPADELLTALDSHPGSGFIAWHSLSNFYYLASAAKSSINPKDFLVDLSRFVDVAETGTASFRYAANLPMRDFEDALQVAAAAACGADVIATRNLRDYRNSPIKAESPGDILSRWS